MTELPQKNIESKLVNEDDFDFLMSEDIFDTGKPPEIDVQFDKYEHAHAWGPNAFNIRVLGWFRDSAVQCYETGKYQESINFCNMALEKGMTRFNYYTGVFDMIVGLCSEQLMLYHQALDRYSNALLQFKEFEQEGLNKEEKTFCERQVQLIEDRLRFIRTVSIINRSDLKRSLDIGVENLREKEKEKREKENRKEKEVAKSDTKPQRRGWA